MIMCLRGKGFSFVLGQATYLVLKQLQQQYLQVKNMQRRITDEKKVGRKTMACTQRSGKQTPNDVEEQQTTLEEAAQEGSDN